MTKTKLINVFSQLSFLEEEKRILNKQLASIKKEETSLKEILSLEIPADSAKNNIFHKVTTKPTVSYGKLYSAVLEELVPKTKLSLAEDLKTSFTSIIEVHSFKLEA